MPYLCSLPNRGGDGHAKFLNTDDPHLIERWIRAEDRPGFGVYYCPNPLKQGAKTHSRESTAAIAVIYIDVDGKDVAEPPDEIGRRLGELLLTPTWIVRSGHGFHVGWELKEPVAHDDPDYENACTLQAALIEYLAGDPQVRPWSLLRRPGTTNSKFEPHITCEVIHRGAVVDLSEIRELVELVADRPLLTRKPKPATNGHAHDAAGFDAEDSGPVDVAARLAAMTYLGQGGNSVHRTQLQVSGALLRQGIPLDDVTTQVLEATKRATANDPRCAGWDWQREKFDLDRMGLDLIAKAPELAGCLGDKHYRQWQEGTERLGPGERLSTSVNAHGAFFRVPHSTRKIDGAPGGEPPAGNSTARKRVLTLRPFEPFDPATLPPRQWLYAKHYQRRTVSLTAGPGGLGKSSLVLVECVAMATARNLLNEQPTERLRVWLHNGEDPLEEILRRLAAICLHFRIPQEELQGQLWITSGNEFPLRVAKGYANLEIDTALVRQISGAIGDNGIDVAAFDPLVTLHSTSEADPGKMDAVIRLFAGIADEHNASVELNHHVRKPPAGNDSDHDVFDVRGVMAITDAVRAARVLNRMGKTDAESAGIDEIARLSHFRVDKAKGNYSPAQAATWRRFVSVDLPNTDNVGVVEPWDFPGQGATTPEKAAMEQQAEHVFLQLLDKFTARGVNVGPLAGPNYAPARFADEREAKVAKVAKAALKAAMGRLLDAGKIRAEPFGRSDRGSCRLVRA